MKQNYIYIYYVSKLPNWPKPAQISDFVSTKKSPPHDFIGRNVRAGELTLSDHNSD